MRYEAEVKVEVRYADDGNGEDARVWYANKQETNVQ